MKQTRRKKVSINYVFICFVSFSFFLLFPPSFSVVQSFQFPLFLFFFLYFFPSLNHFFHSVFLHYFFFSFFFSFSYFFSVFLPSLFAFFAVFAERGIWFQIPNFESSRHRTSLRAAAEVSSRCSSCSSCSKWQQRSAFASAEFRVARNNAVCSLIGSFFVFRLSIKGAIAFLLVKITLSSSFSLL